MGNIEFISLVDSDDKLNSYRLVNNLIKLLILMIHSTPYTIQTCMFYIYVVCAFCRNHKRNTEKRSIYWTFASKDLQ